MLKKILSLLIILTLTLTFTVGCSGTTTEPDNQESETPENDQPEEYTLKLGHVTQTAHPFHIGAEKFAEKVSEKSDGRITIDIYPARALGDDRELLEQIMNNTLDMGVVSGPVFSAYTPVIDTLQLPFMLNSYEKELEAVQSDEMRAILDYLSEYDLKGLAVFEGGMRHLANNIRPITKPEDLEGLKMRATQSDLVIEVLESLGANPIPMAYGEIYTSLQTKVINGQEINITSVSAEKHYEVLNYMSEIGLFPFPGITIMNNELFNELSKEDQEIIQEAANEAMVELLNELPKIDEQALSNIKENSEVEFIMSSEIDLEPFKEKVQSIYDEYTAKNDLIKNFVEMAR